MNCFKEGRSSCSSMTAMPASVCAPFSSVMGEREQQLKQQISCCQEGSSEHAALLTELAGLSLAQGRMDEANSMLQQVYIMRMKDFVASTGAQGTLCSVSLDTQQHQEASSSTVDAVAAAVHGPAQDSLKSAELHIAPAAVSVTNQTPNNTGGGGSSSSSSSSSREGSKHHAQQQAHDGDAWDKSDDWEPDLTALQKAGSVECSKAQQRSSSPVGHAADMPAGAASECWRRPGTGSSSCSTPTRPSSSGAQWGSSSSRPGSAPGSQPRGRGGSKCGATSDSDNEWDTLLPVPNQPHIVEIYGLNRAVKTSHIEEFLLQFMWDGTAATVKWVDDEHALAVFPCAAAAQALLEYPQKEYKVRPYSKASGAALQIAAEDVLPPRGSRPKTTTAVARRLISNALGNREVRDRAAEKELAEMRKANKQGKQQRQQQLDATWGDGDNS